MITITVDPVVIIAIVVLIGIMCFRWRGNQQCSGRPEPEE